MGGAKIKEKVLVIGASGSLGTKLMEEFSSDFEVVGTYYRNKRDGLIHLDIRDEEEVRETIAKTKPDVVIITAAKTNVESCELEPKDTFSINVLGLENIIRNCENQKVVFFSTDNVFNGLKDEYTEDDAPNSINIYGESKARGEEIVRRFSNHIICRSSRFYGAEKTCSKYLNKVIETLSEGYSIKAPVETPGNFTFIPDISAATLALILTKKIGTYHVAGPDIYSLYDAALKVAEVFNFDKSLVIPVDKDYFNGKVKRPSSPLNINKLKSEGINMNGLKEGLIFIKRMFSII